MTPEQTKLKRLLRLEKVRAIAKQTAASEAARAEGTLSQLRALAERTGEIAADYAARRDPGDGGGLRQMAAFTAGLHGIQRNTEADVARARAVADRRQAELAAAERRRAAVEDRAGKQAREIAAKAQYAALGGKRSAKTNAAKETGTAFE